MDIISDTIYEIFGAFMLMFAISVMITMNTAGMETTQAIDSNIRSKTTITEGVSTVNREIISGSSVYYNICQYAKDRADISIYLTKSDAPSVKTAITESVMNAIREKEVSSALVAAISGSSNYRVIYNTDSNGTIKSVTYEQQI